MDNNIDKTVKTVNNSGNILKNTVMAVIVAVVLIGGSLIYKQSPGFSKQASQEEVSSKVINFINNDILKGQATAELLETTKENNLYKLRLSIDGEEFFSYASLDGTLFFPEVINLK